MWEVRSFRQSATRVRVREVRSFPRAMLVDSDLSSRLANLVLMEYRIGPS
jgi:hypothetical protein